MKYIALLRGINVGGNNKVAMPELKACFEALGFTQVSTYINSGNVLFETTEPDVQELIKLCEATIEATFGFKVICSVISAKALQEAAAKAPEWWGIDNDDKHNAIFVIPPLTASDVLKQMGDIKPEYEKIASAGPVIFWSAPLATFSRTRYSKIVGSAVYKSVTMRNANTFHKLLELSNR